MAHCRIPVIDHLAIENVGDELRGAVLQLEVTSADGSHGGPKEIHADLAAHAPTTLRGVALLLGPASMLAVDEPRPGTIRAVLRDAAGTVRAEVTKDVTILAGNQWKARPLQLALEMLAAHVQPNAAAVSTLMLEVSDRLQALTGRSAIDGYQSDDPARADAIAQAVFEAMRDRDIRYAEPPASWGLDGQKVRTPAEVLDGRLGTCLDTTLTMAAVLEQAGINSTVWVLGGHAFLGYWRVDSALANVSTTEAVDVVNLVDLDQIRLVETTLLTGGAQAADFAEATATARAKHLADLSNILGITDIRQARAARIYPLPSHATDLAGNVTVTEYQAAAGPVIAPYVRSEGVQQAPKDTVPVRVRQWKNALLDLSLRNRLINYTERAGFALAVPGPTLARFEDDINAGARIHLLASDEISQVDAARGVRYGRDLPDDERTVLLADKRSAYLDVTSAAYKTRLRSLAYKAKTISQETGANNLYLAFGMLNWRLADRELRSPVVLVPVSLSTANRGDRYVLSIDEAGASTPNYCLIEKLRVSFGLEIPELSNPAEDASGIDLAGTFDAVRRAIAAAGLPFRVEETVALSILQFAKFPLWKDLDESWAALADNSLVRHLIDTPLAAYTDPVPAADGVDLNELRPNMPVPADSSQLQAIAEAVAGRTFVLEGPPGTGKSQTITNLLAHAMASGRKVLFVAEKKAALDVVKKRLDAVGLGELSLNLHDKSARPAAVREQIKTALELRVSADNERLRTNQQIAAAARTTLARYAERLHAENAAGLSAYTARSKELAADQDVDALEVPRELVATVSPETLAQLGELLRALPTVADLARPRADHPWAFLDAAPADISGTYRAAVEFDTALAGLLDDGQAHGIGLVQLDRASAPAALSDWARLAGAPRYPLAAIDALNTAAWAAELTALGQSVAGLSAQRPGWLDTAGPQAMDLDIPSIHAAAVAADDSGFFGRKKRRRAVLAQLADVLVVDEATIDLKGLSSGTAAIAETHGLVSDLRRRVSSLPVTLVDGDWNPLLPETAARLQAGLAWLVRLVAELTAAGPHVADLREFYARTPVGALAGPLERLGAAWTGLEQATGVTLEAQRAWADGAFFDRWWAGRSARRLETPATLEHWLGLVSHVEPLRTAGMTAARAAILTGRVLPEDAALGFERGVAAVSVGERLDANSLSGFDVAAHGKTIQRFTDATRAIREELPRAIPAALLAERRFDAWSESGQVGGLRRQLERKRGGMSIRGLLDNFGELITAIMPCTLMSPDSVARFFPAKPGLFDIVVFDEASQVRVADAIGAMGRSTSVVVVGDSKQMPPTSFAEAGVADDDEDYAPDTVADEESILTECVQSQVPRQWLSWHYRSQDEALIAFSNQNYYEGRLASFPAPRAAAGAGHGVSLVRVDGTFERAGKGKTLRTNRVEAERIVADIRQRFASSPVAAPSLGVITFNAQQRDFIENLLRDSGDDRLLQALDEPDGLFVKNLENVQGDERDTILFSVAFSANDKNVVPLNFGPLSRPGGERRLNVAITRARREVVLYSSFDPAALRAEETSQVGTKHLKAYLEMAARGVDALGGGGRRQPVFDYHRDDIASALRSAGLSVAVDVGLSEFRVDLVLSDPAAPDTPLVAVLLDGPGWYSRRTVADRDGLPVDVLSGLLKWPAVERVWLPEWLQSRDATAARLQHAVAEARERKAATVEVVAPPELVAPVMAAPEPVVEKPLELAPLRSAPIAPVAAPRRHPMLQTFREWTPVAIGDVSVLDEVATQYAKEKVRNVIEAVIAAEGPIHPDRLAKLVAGAFGLNRVAESRRKAIRQLVPADYYRRSDPEGFYWPAGIDPQTWRVVRCPDDGASRPIDEISLIEIGNAMLVIAEQTGGIEAEELKREALGLFGGKRMTAGIETRLGEALERAVASGWLMQTDAGFVSQAD
ncbi:DNA helicase [Mycolicibacter virginiensis]|uniref:DNA helicase n=2 Tax=Mycolicibacter virginiensis TaxID=1795032 RepID=A0A9X7IQ56_9MYCO|nr:DNA helicase [Mycolicibacter virginiensis]